MLKDRFTMTSVPNTLSEIGPDWLNSVLSSDLRGGRAIVAVACDPLGASGSFIGQVGRLGFTYEGPGVGIQSALVKLPTDDATFRKVGKALGFYRREVGFYRELSSRVPIRVPAAYYVTGDDSDGAYAVLLEDLGGMRTGDHIAGCSLAEAQLVMRELAALHAAYWNNPSLSAHAAWLPAEGDSYFVRTETAFQRTLPDLTARTGDIVPPEFITLANRVGRQYREVRSVVNEVGITLTHGDCRLENFLFGDHSSADPIALVDWQNPSQSMPHWDTGYFLLTNFDDDWRRQNQRGLISEYQAALEANGLPGVSPETCWEDFRKGGLLVAVAAVTLASTLNPSSDPGGQELLRRIIGRQARAVIELEVGAFLPRE